MLDFSFNCSRVGHLSKCFFVILALGCHCGVSSSIDKMPDAKEQDLFPHHGPGPKNPIPQINLDLAEAEQKVNRSPSRTKVVKPRTGVETSEQKMYAIESQTHESSLEKLIAEVPRCESKSPDCFGIALHVVMINGNPVQDAQWLKSQIRETKRLFQPVGIEFEIVQVLGESKKFARVETREQRDAIGASGLKSGLIDVYMVEKLADVDKIGEQIRGVHWRKRNDTSQRWIIVSKIAKPGVLAHELGHFFGLPHSSYVESIMNKRPREAPKWSERIFARPELAIIESHRDRMKSSGRLQNRSKRPRQ